MHTIIIIISHYQLIYTLNDTIFIISALYATRIELKWNNQDEIVVQTLSFNSMGLTKI